MANCTTNEMSKDIPNETDDGDYILGLPSVQSPLKIENQQPTINNDQDTHLESTITENPSQRRTFINIFTFATPETHTRKGELKPTYYCKICNRKCKSPSVLKQHQLSHTGEKPFQCEICGKRLTREYHLINHIRGIHRKEKPFQCDICKKYYTSSVNLKTHKMTLHSEKRPLQCDICGKAFVNAGSSQRNEGVQKSHSVVCKGCLTKQTFNRT